MKTKRPPSRPAMKRHRNRCYPRLGDIDCRRDWKNALESVGSDNDPVKHKGEWTTPADLAAADENAPVRGMRLTYAVWGGRYANGTALQMLRERGYFNRPLPRSPFNCCIDYEDEY